MGAEPGYQAAQGKAFAVAASANGGTVSSGERLVSTPMAQSRTVFDRLSFREARQGASPRVQYLHNEMAPARSTWEAPWADNS